jgi:D-aminopeptidase
MPPPVRARDLGVPFAGNPGLLNAITDVPGFEVGMVTLSEACTGITALLPRGRLGVGIPCAAGKYVLNGNGEMTGSCREPKLACKKTPTTWLHSR